MTTMTTERITELLRTRAGTLAAGATAAATLATGVGMAAQGAQPPDTTTTATATETTTQAQTAATNDSKNDTNTENEDWTAPVSDDYELTATYGNGGDRWASAHSGQDFAIPEGTPVEAVTHGTIVKAGPNGGGDGPAYGNAIVIEHTDGTYSQYAHLSETHVNTGDTVNPGDPIALSGNTGNSSGPHLHFEIRTTPDYGTAIDPVTHLNNNGITI